MGCTSSVVLHGGIKREIESKPGPTQEPIKSNGAERIDAEEHAPIIPEEETTTGGPAIHEIREFMESDEDDTVHILGKINENEEFIDGNTINIDSESSEDYLIAPEIPQVYLDHVIGLDLEKRTIKEVIDTFVFNFDDFTEVGMFPTKGVLLYGPSGCGKSLLAEAFACKYAFNFLSVKVPELNEPYATKLIEKLNEAVPCILLLKRLDAVVDAENKKEIKKALNKIVEQIIDASKRIFVFGTTRKEKNVDSTLLRNGRLEKRIQIPRPDKEARLTKWRALLDQPNRLFYRCELDFVEIADLTRGFTHADLEYICEITFKNCGITMDISNQRQTVVINRDHLVSAINEYHDFSRGNSMIENPD